MDTRFSENEIYELESDPALADEMGFDVRAYIRENAEINTILSMFGPNLINRDSDALHAWLWMQHEAVWGSVE